ncbi:MAG TPA: radical SAM protein [Thermoguttaceae bacterium]|nr:radical SAM protein [Thermoguttaceae bacterium]
MTSSSPRSSASPLFEAHPRSFRCNRYVYPVLSRRSRGISIGVNLSLDKNCNFDCVYCQVDRTEPTDPQRLDPARLAVELDEAIASVTSGRLFEGPMFQNVPVELRRLNDIALSGDGEPTLHEDFPRAVEACAEARRRHGLTDVKLVLITNASMLHREPIRRALDVLQANQGEIWAKLDAGTEAYYRQMNRSGVPFEQILDNLTETARRQPIVIQTLFASLRGQGPSDAELAAYAEQLRRIVDTGGQIKCVHLHTVARRPAEPWVAPLADEAIDAIGARLRSETGLTVETFHA